MPRMKRNQAGRRANGEGTRPRKRKDGRWYVDVSIPLPEGGSKRVKVYSRVGAEDCADQARRLRLEHVDAGGYREPERRTLGDFLTQWLSDEVQPTRRRKTYRSYAGTVNNHLIPSLGAIPIAKLEPAMIARALASDDPDGARTRELAHGTLKTALKVAVEWGIIDANPVERVRKPRVPKEEMRFYAPAEVDALLAARGEDRLAALYPMAIVSGMRAGELYGVRWSDLALEDWQVHVRMQLDDERLVRVPPKTKAAIRTIDLSRAMVEELREHRKRMLAEGLRTAPWVFCNPKGGPLRQSGVRRWSWIPLKARAFAEKDADGSAKWVPLNGVVLPAGSKKRVVRQYLIPERLDIRFHDLRHTAATLMFAAGIHPLVVSKRLGHSSVEFTMRQYGHLLPSLQAGVAESVARFLADARKGPASITDAV
jgi:integrase